MPKLRFTARIRISGPTGSVTWSEQLIRGGHAVEQAAPIYIVFGIFTDYVIVGELVNMTVKGDRVVE